MFPPAPLLIEPLDPASPAARDLLTRSDAYLAALYPAESNHLESVAALRQDNVLFLGAWLAGELVACGAVKVLHDDGSYGEIKRVFVLDSHRGKGLAEALMQRLEDHLRSLGIGLARLETGVAQPAALQLYARLGYVEREPFGSYRSDPLCRFMEKRLEGEAPVIRADTESGPGGERHQGS